MSYSSKASVRCESTEISGLQWVYGSLVPQLGSNPNSSCFLITVRVCRPSNNGKQRKLRPTRGQTRCAAKRGLRGPFEATIDASHLEQGGPGNPLIGVCFVVSLYYYSGNSFAGCCVRKTWAQVGVMIKLSRVMTWYYLGRSPPNFHLLPSLSDTF